MLADDEDMAAEIIDSDNDEEIQNHPEIERLKEENKTYHINYVMKKLKQEKRLNLRKTNCLKNDEFAGEEEREEYEKGGEALQKTIDFLHFEETRTYFKDYCADV